MKALILTIVLASLTGCVTAEQYARTLDAQSAKQICDTFTQLNYDGKLDTPLTKSEIKKYNRQITAFCRNH